MPPSHSCAAHVSRSRPPIGGAIVLPDDRLRELLRREQDGARPTDEFVDQLFKTISNERGFRGGLPQWLRLPRFVPAAAIAVPLVVFVALAGLVAIQNLSFTGPGV